METPQRPKVSKHKTTRRIKVNAEKQGKKDKKNKCPYMMNLKIKICEYFKETYEYIDY